MITRCGTAFQGLGVCVQGFVDKSQRACHGETVEGMQAYHASKGVHWRRSGSAASGDGCDGTSGSSRSVMSRHTKPIGSLYRLGVSVGLTA